MPTQKVGRLQKVSEPITTQPSVRRPCREAAQTPASTPRTTTRIVDIVIRISVLPSAWKTIGPTGDW